jgi:uncharacterized YccA/Bax inhibitor family protein
VGLTTPHHKKLLLRNLKKRRPLPRQGDHLLLRDFGPYGILFMNVCVLLLPLPRYGDHLLLRDFGPYGIIFMNVCLVITVATVW